MPDGASRARRHTSPWREGPRFDRFSPIFCRFILSACLREHAFDGPERGPMKGRPISNGQCSRTELAQVIRAAFSGTFGFEMILREPHRMDAVRRHSRLSPEIHPSVHAGSRTRTMSYRSDSTLLGHRPRRSATGARARPAPPRRGLEPMRASASPGGECVAGLGIQHRVTGAVRPAASTGCPLAVEQTAPEKLPRSIARIPRTTPKHARRDSHRLRSHPSRDAAKRAPSRPTKRRGQPIARCRSNP